jgi:hypothetical protein
VDVGSIAVALEAHLDQVKAEIEQLQSGELRFAAPGQLLA